MGRAIVEVADGVREIAPLSQEIDGVVTVLCVGGVEVAQQYDLKLF